MHAKCVLLCSILFGSLNVVGQVSVLTYHFDNARTGQNTQESVLTPSNVNSSQFGKLFSQAVDGQLYAQPLYMSNLNIPNKGTHNVVYVATEADSVYAFDADNNSGANANPLWKASLLDAAHGAASGATPVSYTDLSASFLPGGCPNIIPVVGISSTPVIDTTKNAIYVEAKSKENGAYVHRLHALDITTGNEIGQPAVIFANVSGVAFDSKLQHSRPALLLANGKVDVAFASHCDIGPYDGWFFAYDTTYLYATGLSLNGVFITTSNNQQGGIWMSGAGPAADSSGNVYLATGNGTADGSTANLGDSIVKLALNGSGLVVSDYFTPGNQSDLAAHDNDVGSGGLVLLPDQAGSHPHLLVHAGKEGKVYLIDRDQMTAGNLHYCPSCSVDPVVQEIPNSSTTCGNTNNCPLGGMWSMPNYWNGSIYFWAVGDRLKKFSLSNGLLSTSPIATSSDSYGYPGANMSISSNGSSNGIVWSLKTDNPPNNPPNSFDPPAPETDALYVPAVLRAHRADTLQLLYSSDANERDDAGKAVKFAVPVVANGKVYVGTTDQLSVYGLLTANGHVQEIFTTSSGLAHQDSNGLSGAPPAAGGSPLAVMVDSSKAANRIFYLSSDGHVQEIYNTSAGLAHRDNTAISGAPVAAPGSPVAVMVDDAGANTIFYLSADGHVQEIWANGAGHEDNTSLSGAPAAVTGSPLAVMVDSTKTANRIFYLSADGHVQEIYNTSTGLAHRDNIALSGAPVAGPGSPVAAMVDNAGANTIYYLSADGHVQEIWGNGASHQDSTALSGAPPAAAGSPLAVMVDNSKTVNRIFYLSLDGHLQEIYNVANGLANRDNTGISGAPPAAPGSPVGAMVDNAGASTIYYLSADGHVQEIWGNGASHQDNTALSGAPPAAAGSPLAVMLDDAHANTMYYLFPSN